MGHKFKRHRLGKGDFLIDVKIKNVFGKKLLEQKNESLNVGMNRLLRWAGRIFDFEIDEDLADLFISKLKKRENNGERKR